jgi:hypothetical protein
MNIFLQLKISLSSITFSTNIPLMPLSESSETNFLSHFERGYCVLHLLPKHWIFGFCLCVFDRMQSPNLSQLILIGFSSQFYDTKTKSRNVEKPIKIRFFPFCFISSHILPPGRPFM